MCQEEYPNQIVEMPESPMEMANKNTKLCEGVSNT
jgi:hypothetical protein